ncbi:M20/M25/M40 family metallo-hydrolase [Glacieibacterium sp.]|uniref:M20/M25/M40 family metallo-hydrolase n=1 Tax=Glacieibacterium sp. TaxID=2860237 RepID=UPI003B000AEE
MKHGWLSGVAAILVAGTGAQAQNAHPGEPAFRDLYKQLVETNTTHSTGSCTQAAAQIASRLKAAGYLDSDLTTFSVPEAPKDGGLVAVLPGSDPKAKAILLLAHLDVVEAKRADWTRDPFALVEENGFFYARGASDDKAMAAIFADTMIRMKAEKRARRTVKLALTCGEETTGVFNGAEYLAANKRDLIDAAFALNEGGGGRVDKDGKPSVLALQVSEKTAENYTLEATNPGGHSSLPRPDNAIYDLVAAVQKVQAYTFPVHLDPTTREFFKRAAPIYPGPAGQAMLAIAANPQDADAAALLSRDPLLNSTLRTTCVATLLDGGHAENALPQHASANINCRIFPGETIEAVRNTLAKVVGNASVTVTAKPRRGPISKATALDPAVIGPAENLAARLYPGLPMVPIMSTGASDSIYLAAVGIPSYGVPGILYEPDGGGIHGLNEHVRVKSVLDGRDYLHQLIRIYAEAK